MKKLLLMLSLVLPLLVVGQIQNYKAYALKVGTWDGNEWKWNPQIQTNVGIVCNHTTLEYIIYAKKTTKLSILSVEQVRDTENTITFSIEAIDQDGVYVVINEVIPHKEPYAHTITLIYPDYGVKYEIEPL